MNQALSGFCVATPVEAPTRLSKRQSMWPHSTQPAFHTRRKMLTLFNLQHHDNSRHAIRTLFRMADCTCLYCGLVHLQRFVKSQHLLGSCNTLIWATRCDSWERARFRAASWKRVSRLNQSMSNSADSSGTVGRRAVQHPRASNPSVYC